MNLTENDLILQAQGGNLEAFGTLYSTYIARVYRFLLSKTRHVEQAEDLTSATFTKALASIATFSPRNSGTFQAWLFTIAYRTFLDNTKKDSRTTVQDLAFFEEMPQSSHKSSEEQAEISLERAMLHQALARLPPAQREAITLRIWHDCSFQEIAVILGKREGAVKMLVRRGIVALKPLLPPVLLFILAAHL